MPGLGPCSALKKRLRWPKEAYEKVNKDPHSIYSALDPEKLLPDLNAKDDGTPVAESGRRPQNIQIRYADWVEYGSTPGCSKCTSALEQGWGVYGGSHSQACLQRYKNIYAGTEEGQMRLDRTQRRLDRRYPEGPNRPTAEEQGIQAKGGGGQAFPRSLQVQAHRRQDDVESQYEELKCQTSDDEGDQIAEDYKATSVAPDEEIPGPDDAVRTIENEILQLMVQLGGIRAKYNKRQHQANQVVTEVYSPPRVIE